MGLGLNKGSINQKFESQKGVVWICLPGGKLHWYHRCSLCIWCLAFRSPLNAKKQALRLMKCLSLPRKIIPFCFEYQGIKIENAIQINRSHDLRKKLLIQSFKQDWDSSIPMPTLILSVWTVCFVGQIPHFQSLSKAKCHCLRCPSTVPWFRRSFCAPRHEPYGKGRIRGWNMCLEIM